MAIELSDDLGRKVQLDKPAQRIVSLIPSVTETLFALGVEERVLGVTDYCIYPPAEVAKKTKVGGPKNVVLETIFSLRPDLVIANVEENRKHQIEQIWNAGIPVLVSFPRTADGCIKMIRDLAKVTETESAAQPIVESIEAARERARRRKAAKPPRILCPIWKNPYRTVNRDTFVHAVIEEAGGENIFADEAERYPKFSLDEAQRHTPEVILLPTEPYHFKEPDKSDFDGWRGARIHIVEGELLTWHGIRLARALDELSLLLQRH
jgi:ABC-type Fe3+-hydroxamate transport system substrate-binding protein